MVTAWCLVPTKPAGVGLLVPGRLTFQYCLPNCREQAGSDRGAGGPAVAWRGDKGRHKAGDLLD